MAVRSIGNFGVIAGTIELSASDLNFWAGLPDARIPRIRNLVIEERWKPRAAVSFLDKAVTEKTKVEELHNLVIAGNGVILNPNDPKKYGEIVEGVENLIVLAYDTTKFKVTVEAI